MTMRWKNLKVGTKRTCKGKQHLTWPLAVSRPNVTVSHCSAGTNRRDGFVQNIDLEMLLEGVLFRRPPRDVTAHIKAFATPPFFSCYKTKPFVCRNQMSIMYRFPSKSPFYTVTTQAMGENAMKISCEHFGCYLFGSTTPDGHVCKGRRV